MQDQQQEKRKSFDIECLLLFYQTAFGGFLGNRGLLILLLHP